jgi:uncharacterized membrane protein
MEGDAMNEKKRDANDSSPKTAVGRTEVVISMLLRTGVLISLFTILLGVVLMFVHHPNYLISRTDLQKLTALGATFPQSLSEVAQGLLALRGQAMVAAGLLLLIVTPIFRVAASIIAFVIERDWTYAAITSAVLLVLLLSFFLGKAG